MSRIYAEEFFRALARVIQEPAQVREGTDGKQITAHCTDTVAKAVFQFDLPPSGSWVLDLKSKEGRGQVYRGQVANPDVTFSAEDTKFIELLRASNDQAIAIYTSGTVQIGGQSKFFPTLKPLFQKALSQEQERRRFEEERMKNKEVASPVPIVVFKDKSRWRADDTTTHCMRDRCKLPFGLLRRKHHCRVCGDIFCNECSSYKIDQQRTCKRCFVTFRTHLKQTRMGTVGQQALPPPESSGAYSPSISVNSYNTRGGSQGPEYPSPASSLNESSPLRHRRSTSTSTSESTTSTTSTGRGGSHPKPSAMTIEQVNDDGTTIKDNSSQSQRPSSGVRSRPTTRKDSHPNNSINSTHSNRNSSNSSSSTITANIEKTDKNPSSHNRAVSRSKNSSSETDDVRRNLKNELNQTTTTDSKRPQTNGRKHEEKRPGLAELEQSQPKKEEPHTFKSNLLYYLLTVLLVLFTIGVAVVTQPDLQWAMTAYFQPLLTRVGGAGAAGAGAAGAGTTKGSS